MGDVTRFTSAKHVCSWAGLTPRHRESDSKVQRGSITKQGPPLARWAAIEAVSKNHGGDQASTPAPITNQAIFRFPSRVKAAPITTTPAPNGTTTYTIELTSKATSPDSISKPSNPAVIKDKANKPKTAVFATGWCIQCERSDWTIAASAMRCPLDIGATRTNEVSVAPPSDSESLLNPARTPTIPGIVPTELEAPGR
ncbi:MAG: IS110 family transposase [Acidimicrobiia bacterium]|nr:IS110 family transposase [Acidimicrobiia bacterium]MDH3396886.1 IS110 family transposase [Acidimicrobiia bacterium]